MGLVCYTGLMEINRENLAWAAGFIDGEGCFLNQKGYSGERKALVLTPRFEIVQHDHRDELDKLVSVFGFGKVDGPKPDDNGKLRVYRVRINGFEYVQAIYSMVYAWLGKTKRSQGREVLLRYLHVTRNFVSVKRKVMEHGTTAMYTNGKCRCRECKFVWSEYQRKRYYGY